MTELRQLTPREVLFVGGEMRNVYHHTAGLVLLDSSDRPDFGFEVFRRHMEERIGFIPQFSWKLHEVPLGLDLPYWVADDNFNPDRHIRRIAVPAPGDREALAEVVAYLYGKHLGRDRPLWEAWFIEGLADGNHAVLYKVHHCLMDGEAAARLFEFMWDFEPDAAPRGLDPAITDARPGEAPDFWQLSLNAARHLSGLPVKAGREIFGVVQQTARRRVTGGGKRAERPAAPGTRFNADIGSDRGLVFCSMPLADIKAIKNHFGVTVNDVVLAMAGSSLRDYLLARGELPQQSLRSSIAVSLRSDGDDNLSNKITATSVTLATDIADPVQRLQTIARDTDRAKKEARRGGKGIMEIMQLLPPVLVNAMIRLTPPDQVPKLMGVNLIVSNVRGGAEPMYIGGARIVALYPMSIINPGGGINITCGSLADDLHFGITIEPELVPDPWLISDGLQTARGEYLARISAAGRSRKNKAAGSRTARKKRDRAPVRRKRTT